MIVIIGLIHFKRFLTILLYEICTIKYRHELTYMAQDI